MKHLVNKIIEQETFSEQEAYGFIHAMNEENLNPEQVSAVLVGIQSRGVKLEELKGFRNALLELSIVPQISGENAIDLCGTGGDGKDTFNISTTTALVLAAMGKKVIKHGNYGASSLCGSSNVLQELGYNFTSNEDQLNQELDKNNICFLHAPLFHPTMKKVAPIRKALGIRTIFNSLGPLVNPVQPKFQLTGTFSLELAKIYQHLLKNDRKDFRVVYGMDGFDEISLTNTTRVLGKYTDELIDASTFNQDKLTIDDLNSGNSVAKAAQIIRSILSGTGTSAHNNVIAANVATALHLFNPQQSVEDHFSRALEFIKHGQAKQALNFN